jgi:Alcohol dehydrogenase GroES-like domain
MSALVTELDPRYRGFFVADYDGSGAHGVRYGGRSVLFTMASMEVLQQVTVDLVPPGPGEVTIEVRAAGMNPADYKHFAPGQDRSLLPLVIGHEIAGAVTAIGPGTQLASGGGTAGDEVVAFQIMGGYASAGPAAGAGGQRPHQRAHRADLPPERGQGGGRGPDGAPSLRKARPCRLTWTTTQHISEE